HWSQLIRVRLYSSSYETGRRPGCDPTSRFVLEMLACALRAAQCLRLGGALLEPAERGSVVADRELHGRGRARVLAGVVLGGGPRLGEGLLVLLGGVGEHVVHRVGRHVVGERGEQRDRVAELADTGRLVEPAGEGALAGGADRVRHRSARTRLADADEARLGEGREFSVDLGARHGPVRTETTGRLGHELPTGHWTFM